MAKASSSQIYIKKKMRLVETNDEFDALVMSHNYTKLQLHQHIRTRHIIWSFSGVGPKPLEIDTAINFPLMEYIIRQSSKLDEIYILTRIDLDVQRSIVCFIGLYLPFLKAFCAGALIGDMANEIATLLNRTEVNRLWIEMEDTHLFYTVIVPAMKNIWFFSLRNEPVPPAMINMLYCAIDQGLLPNLSYLGASVDHVDSRQKIYRGRKNLITVILLCGMRPSSTSTLKFLGEKGLLRRVVEAYE